ncbi:MAG: hypothetical protein LBD96_10070 [Treponema sp.]|jgi:hypothetical protein|nr:hypothetical protein [Treponema sp.]
MFKFSTAVLIPGSLLVGLVLLYAVPESFVRGVFPSGGYAILAFEEADGGMVQVLEQVLGRPVLSEFSQWVFLNNFGSLEQVPLGEYGDRLEIFDPRRDAYAVKLRDFFTQDGKHWFFIPLDRGMFGLIPPLNPERALKKRIGRALGGGSFSVILKQEGRPLGFCILPFALAWPALLFLAGGNGSGPLKRRDRRGILPSGSRGPGRRILLLLGPPLFALSLWGAPGCAVVALFLYLGVLVAPPLQELWLSMIRGRQKENRQAPRPGPYRFNVVVSLALTPLFVLIIRAGQIPLLPGLAGLGGLFVLYFSCLGVQLRRLGPAPSGSETSGGRESCRFVPLPILPPRSGYSPLPAPFALACALAFLLNLPPGFWAGGAGAEPWPLLVVEQDYEDHVLFQTGFARRSLREDASSAFAVSSYFHYTMGEDGLVEGVFPGPPETGPEIPPFPLADLSDFLAGWAVPAGPSWNSGGWTAIIPLFPALALLFLPLGRVGGKKIAVYDDKRIAA